MHSLTNLPDFRQKTAEGLIYAHSRLNANTSKILEATVFLYAPDKFEVKGAFDERI
jgi:hypothetical protein